MGDLPAAGPVLDVEAYLGGSRTPPPPPPLADSWERSRALLGMPDNIREVPHVADELLDDALLDMFQAPLERVSTDLEGTGFALLLADAQGRILQRWTGDRNAETHLSRVGTERGADLSEARVGTNGVGTVAATGRGVQIRGSEHYADFYRDALCTGAPVRHPVSGRLLAVVTISSDMTKDSTALRPLVRAITGQLEQHVLESESPEARRMLAAFLDASRTHGSPVVAFGPYGLIMQSRTAGRLSAQDLQTLEQIASTAGPDRGQRVALSTGPVDLRTRTLEGEAGTLVMLDRSPASGASALVSAPRRPLVGRSAAWLASVHTVARYRELGRPLLIAGEVGAGKASLALGAPVRPRNGAESPVLETAERAIIGSRAWLSQLSARLQSGRPTIVRGVELLDAALHRSVAALIERGSEGPVLMTASAGDTTEAQLLADRLGLPLVWMPALRERDDDVVALWRFFADQFAPGAGLHPTPETAALLRGYAWPRNLKELRGVVEELAVAGRRGPVLPADLPARVQGARTLSMMERAELEAIRRALTEAAGNRSHAAEILGVSRATIYRKMKTYKLTS